jgi:hypothetical protein
MRLGAFLIYNLLPRARDEAIGAMNEVNLYV